MEAYEVNYCFDQMADPPMAMPMWRLTKELWRKCLAAKNNPHKLTANILLIQFGSKNSLGGGRHGVVAA